MKRGCAKKELKYFFEVFLGKHMVPTLSLSLPLNVRSQEGKFLVRAQPHTKLKTFSYPVWSELFSQFLVGYELSPKLSWVWQKLIKNSNFEVIPTSKQSHDNLIPKHPPNSNFVTKKLPPTAVCPKLLFFSTFFFLI